MKYMRIVLLALVAGLSALPAFAEINVQSVMVRQGFFEAPDCTPTADPKSFNECICKADIRKAQLTGGTPDAMAAVNTLLSAVPEQLSAESCEGATTTAPAAQIGINEAKAGYEVVYQTPDLLTILVTYSTYGAGAAHPLDGTEGFTVDLKTGKQIDPIQLLKPDQIAKANRYVHDTLIKNYADTVFDEVKARTDPFLTENGCDTCTLYFTKDGWNIRFQLYAVAPYVSGEPTFAIPSDIIPPADTLIAKR